MKNCDRCGGKLSYAEEATPLVLKGGFSGFFCAKCMNAWNLAYHSSPAAKKLRDGAYKLDILAAAAQGGNHSLADLMVETSVASSMVNEAMKELFELAKKTMTACFKTGGTVSGRLSSAAEGGDESVTRADSDTYLSPITGKRV